MNIYYFKLSYFVIAIYAFLYLISFPHQLYISFYYIRNITEITALRLNCERNYCYNFNKIN